MSLILEFPYGVCMFVGVEGEEVEISVWKILHEIYNYGS